MNENPKSLFEKFLFEAPGDDPPDTAPEPEASDPPVEEPSFDDAPPDITDEPIGADEPPPDIGGDNEFASDDTFGDEQPEIDLNDKNLGLDDKVSAIMNMNLYQSFLSLLNSIGGQISSIKDKLDVLSSLSKDSINVLQSLEKLDENIRLYLKNYFINENYSKNLLFFNKCLNLLKLLNDSFHRGIDKGIKDME